MLGIILGFSTAFAFACITVIARRAVLFASPNYVANISILTGPIFSLVVAAVTGDLYLIGKFPWEAYVFLALSGILHFAIGRTWAYKSIQLIGANRSNIVISLSPIVSMALAVIVLKETVNFLMVFGIICSLSSPFITLLKEQTVAGDNQTMGAFRGKEVDWRTLYLGMLYAVGVALFWGASLILIKLGLEKGGTPIAGNLIAYSAALIAIIPSLLKRGSKRELFTADRKSLQLALLVGLISNIAQLLRYLALEYGSVIIVTAMIRTTPLGVLLLSFLINREYESFSRWVLLSNALLIVGTVLILIAQR